VDHGWRSGGKIQHFGWNVDRHRRYIAIDYNHHFVRVQTDSIRHQLQHVILCSHQKTWLIPRVYKDSTANKPQLAFIEGTERAPYTAKDDKFCCTSV